MWARAGGIKSIYQIELSETPLHQGSLTSQLHCHCEGLDECWRTTFWGCQTMFPQQDMWRLEPLFEVLYQTEYSRQKNTVAKLNRDRDRDRDIDELRTRRVGQLLERWSRGPRTETRPFSSGSFICNFKTRICTFGYLSNSGVIIWKNSTVNHKYEEEFLPLNLLSPNIIIIRCLDWPSVKAAWVATVFTSFCSKRKSNFRHPPIRDL